MCAEALTRDLFEPAAVTSPRRDDTDSLSDFSSVRSNFSDMSQTRLFDLASRAAAREHVANVAVDAPLAAASPEACALASAQLAARFGHACVALDWRELSAATFSVLLETLLPLVLQQLPPEPQKRLVLVCQDGLAACTSLSSFIALFLATHAEKQCAALRYLLVPHCPQACDGCQHGCCDAARGMPPVTHWI